MKRTLALCVITATAIWAQDPVLSTRPAQPPSGIHQKPDQDGVYYVGPEVTPPRLLRAVLARYPSGVPGNRIQGMTVMAMVIDANGLPQHIQLLHGHGDAFDQAAINAVKQSKFAPGTLADKPVPVWIDIRVALRANLSQAVPEVLIPERDLPSPGAEQLEDKHGKPLKYTPPIPIHTVDADFVNPFTKYPITQVAIVSVLVDAEGLPKDVHVQRGLGFGLDEKARAAVERYRFYPATQNGKPIEARRNLEVKFIKW
jgi:TonB family protein